MAKKETGYDRVVERFYRYNIERTGPDNKAESNWSFRGSILYHGTTPVARLVQISRTHFAALHRTYVRPSHQDLRAYVHSLVLPDIGVFSKFPGDWLEGDALHDRMRFILIADISYWLETEVETLSGKILEARGWHNAKELRKTLLKKYETYDSYRDLFKLSWPDLPEQLYLGRFDAFVDKRIGAYKNPEAVLRRERAAARRIAAKALDIDRKK